MRYDHITSFNDQMEAARHQVDDTLSTLHHQHQQLENLVAMTNDVLQVIGGQIEEIERLRHVVGQLVANDGPTATHDTPNKLSVALRAVDAQEKANGKA